MNLQDAITAAQAAKKTLAGADGNVSAEKADVDAKQIIVDDAKKALDAAIAEDVADRAGYKASLADLLTATQAEIDGLTI